MLDRVINIIIVAGVVLSFLFGLPFFWPLKLKYAFIGFCAFVAFATIMYQTISNSEDQDEIDGNEVMDQMFEETEITETTEEIKK